jgi:hypothetical protein
MIHCSRKTQFTRKIDETLAMPRDGGPSNPFIPAFYDVFVFAKQCQQVYYTYNPSFRKDRSRVDWLSILKTKPKGLVEVV